MLVRAYRLTDRLGLVILKSMTLITDLMLSNLHLLSGRTTAGAGGIFTLVVGAVGLIINILLRAGQAILWLVRWLFYYLRRIATVLFTVLRRITGQTTTSLRQTSADAMARRSTRTQIDKDIVEDPLRAQNRVLSGLVVIVLLALIGVVIWATGNNTTSDLPAPRTVNLNVADATSIPEEGITSLNLATPVPTATTLPEVLQVRGSLAYVQREGGQTDIWAAPVDSQTRLRITNSPQDERDPAWSPDGQRLAYASNQDGNWDIYIYDLASNNTTRMTFGLGFEAAPDWSPDGTFLVYESYQSGTHLDLFAMRADGSEPPFVLVASGSADFSPAWAPGDGRRIAFTSWREGNQDIYIFDLDTGETINVTNTPNRHEDYPAWSPDGDLLAFSAVEAGIETVFIQQVNDLNQPSQAFGRGRVPAWSPGGTSIVAAVDTEQDTRIVVLPFVDSGVTTQVIQANKGATSPVWTSAPLPTSLVNAGGLDSPITEPLFVEDVRTTSGDPPYGLGQLFNISGVEPAYLSDTVNDSFNALREAANEKIGRDFLGTLSDALWDLDHRPQPGEPRRNWHMTGRSFSFNRNQIIGGFPPPVEVVREDSDLATYWRVYVRVADSAQDGQLGEPLRRMPWAFVSPETGDVEAYERGGRLKDALPEGYYVDLTQLAEDYGWMRVPAGSDWRANVYTRNFWTFQKREGLTWYDAMRQLYTDAQLGGWVPTPTPAPPVPPTLPPVSNDDEEEEA